MHKPVKSRQLNKPFLLICLFTFSTLAAMLVHTGEAQQAGTVPVPVARDAGHGGTPLCNSDAFKLSAQCQPERQA